MNTVQRRKVPGFSIGSLLAFISGGVYQEM